MTQTFSSDPASFGDFFHVRLNGTSLDDMDKRVLAELRPIGVQLTLHNFLQSHPYEQVLENQKKLLDDVFAYTGRERMLVSIDHEGGRVHRLPKPFTHFPSPAEYYEHAYAVALAMGRELDSLGINLSFSPSLDVNSNPKNPVIGKRSFHADADRVALAGRAFAQGLQDAGILPCAKHFPGHGDTQIDSHFGLPELSCDESRLWDCELRPFQDLIDWGIPIIMSAHIRFPAIDAKFPATLSHAFLQDILRRRMKFEGVIYTDDLDMQAITDHFDEAALADRVPRAGGDVFLLNHTPIRGLRIAQVMYENLEQDAHYENLLYASRHRMNSLFSHYAPQSTVKVLSPEIFAEHAELKSSIIKPTP